MQELIVYFTGTARHELDTKRTQPEQAPLDDGLDWIGLDWIGLDWIGLDWIRSFVR